MSLPKECRGGFVDSSGVVQLSFAPPYLQDSSKTPAGVSPATLSLSQVGSALTVSLRPNATWLASPARVWPIVVDPQVTLTPTTNCYLQSGNGQSSNFCSTSTLDVGYDGASIYRTLLLFDLSSIPYDATVKDATLQLYLSSASGSGSSTVEGHRLIQGWTNGATWVTTDGTTKWTTAGGTFDGTVSGSQSINVGSTGTWQSFAIPSLAQTWVNALNPNQGILLKTSSETTANLFGFASASTTSAPSLSITWHHWTGLLPYWTYYSHGLTDRSDLSVNVANGNLVFHDRDLTIAGTGLPLSLDRYYNGFQTNYADVGAGWTLDYGLGFHLDSSGNAGISLRGPNGYLVVFGIQGSSYVTPPGIDADLVKNADGTFTLTWHANGTKDNFGTASPSGISNLTSVVDRNGNTISLAYNADGTVHTITDTQGRVVTFAYVVSNGQTFISSITDATGRQVQYSYSNDTNHNLSDYWDAANNHTIYTYSGNNLTQIDDAKGNRTLIGYGAQGSAVTSITFVTNKSTNAGATYSFNYTKGNNAHTVVTDPNNVTTTYYYDKFGKVTQIADNAQPTANTQQFTWTSDNHIATHTDAYNHTTTYSYDGNDNLTEIQLPTGANDQWQYLDTSHPFYPTVFKPSNYFDNPSNPSQNNHNQITYTYDTPGNLHTITDQLSSQNTETINHNANGTISSVVDFNLNTTSYGYDTKGNLTSITPPAPLAQVAISPDALSRVSTYTDGDGKVQTYTYDPLDRVTNLKYQQGTTTSNIANTFDADGDLTQMQDVPASGATVTTSYVYDALDRVLAKSVSNLPTSCTVNATNYTVCYGYDNASNLTSFQDAGGQVTYGYNNLEEVTSLVEPGGTATTTFGYDNNHRRTTTAYPV